MVHTLRAWPSVHTVTMIEVSSGNSPPSTLREGDWQQTCTILGVPDKVIQAILRHGNVAVTLSYYVKPLDQDVCDGMDRLEREVNERRDTDGTVN